VELKTQEFGLIKEMLKGISNVTDTEVVCAGGAARDLIMNNYINDYDIFIDTPSTPPQILDDYIMPAIREILVEIYCDNEIVSDIIEITVNSYPEHWVNRIYEISVLNNRTFQFIFCKNAPVKIIPELFPFSLSQAWFSKNDMEPQSSEIFKKSLKTKVAIYSFSCSTKYLQKMMTKFRGFAFMPANHEWIKKEFSTQLLKNLEIPF